MKTLPRSFITACATFACLVGSAHADPTFLGPTPYLSFDDSPFKGGSFGYFYLETFEDHLLNTPGVSADSGGVTSVVFGPLIHDSVDADDGAIDGSGLKGDSYFTASGATGVRFTFSAAALGSLPTSAGIVWTDHRDLGDRTGLDRSNGLAGVNQPGDVARHQIARGGLAVCRGRIDDQMGG